MTITDWIQAVSMVVLVGVTAIYAWRTHIISKATGKQADASVKMAEEMRNARSPSITITWIGADRNNKNITVILKNEGFGPALNLEWYLTGKELEFSRNPIVYTTFEVGQKYTLSLKSESFDFKSWNGLAINCVYASVLGEKTRSTLRCESEKERKFEIVKLK